MNVVADEKMTAPLAASVNLWHTDGHKTTFLPQAVVMDPRGTTSRPSLLHIYYCRGLNDYEYHGPLFLRQLSGIVYLKCMSNIPQCDLGNDVGPQNMPKRDPLILITKSAGSLDEEGAA